MITVAAPETQPQVAAVEAAAAVPEVTTFRSKLADMDIPDHLPLHEYCFARAAELPDAPCLIAAATGRTYTFAETHLLCRKAAAALHRLGVAHGDRVMILLQNSVEFAVAFFGASFLGAVTTAANPFCTPQEIHKQFKASGAKLILTQSAYVDKLRHEAFPRIGTGGGGGDTLTVITIDEAKSAMPAEYADHGEWYGASLRSVSAGGAAKMLYAYDTVLHGFSARLTEQEASDMARMEGVLAVNPETRYELHTTRTPEFLGLAGNEGLFPQSGAAGDVVVGVLDTGVWPESKSYVDAGLAEVPSWWKGECMAGTGFNSSACNRKLVGARFFSRGYEAAMGPMDTSRESRSPRDDDGHGTHTSSTAAGAAVADVSLFGFASGTARGMAPKARVSVYKVCWLGGCFSSDILAGMDAAVADGCGVLSLSLGGGAADYARDSVSIGAFAAMEQNVLVSCSAGNAGPGSSTLSNVAPWITTVGAGTLDRNFPADVVLSNGKNYTGVSLYAGKALPTTPLPIIYAANASNSTSGNLCMPGTLSPEKVAGKIVVCDRGVSARVQKGFVVRDAGGAGMVLSNTAANGQELVADAHLLPAAGVGAKEGTEIKSYLASDPNPTATIVVAGTQVDVRPSPVVAAFSSRGPNMVTPEILKPDVIAPGVNILAAWTGKAGPTGQAADTRRVNFNIISGTSMSCPHVSGLAALLRSAHPEWSPAAVRSALMTTAYSTYTGGAGSLLDAATGAAATPFDYGAGHVDPTRAVDPGLVYDLGTSDYVDFLCALKYTPTMIAAVARSKSYACAENKTYSVANLNYPSFSVAYSTANSEAGDSGATTVTHTRTLTNVGAASTYKVSTSVAVTGVTVAVQPTELAFTSAGEKKNYTVSFTAKSQPSGTAGFGRLVWSDGKHSVASPIAFTWT